MGLLDGKTALVTGGTSGIGQETALALATLGATLVLPARNPARAAETVKRIQAQVPGARVDVVEMDLSSQKSIATAAALLLKSHPTLHILVNNAGVVLITREQSVDGVESMLATNHLGPFLLTNLLLPALRAAGNARVVTVASDAEKFGDLDLHDLDNVKMGPGMRLYGRTKKCNILFSHALARREASHGITANCLHPGAVSTRLGTNNGRLGQVAMALLKPFFRTAAQGAATSIFLASSPAVEGVTGKYFKDCKVVKESAQAANTAVGEAVWAWSEQRCRLSFWAGQMAG